MERESRDLIGEMGLLALGSRFRRLGERLQAGVAALAREADIPVQPAHFALLVALAEQPRTIGGLVMRLDIAQPGVTRSVNKLVADGLIEVVPKTAEAEQRQRKLRLTRQGQALLARARRDLLPDIERAVAAMAGSDLLALLDRIDDALQETTLDARVRAARAEQA